MHIKWLKFTGVCVLKLSKPAAWNILILLCGVRNQTDKYAHRNFSWPYVPSQCEWSASARSLSWADKPCFLWIDGNSWSLCHNMSESTCRRRRQSHYFTALLWRVVYAGMFIVMLQIWIMQRIHIHVIIDHEQQFISQMNETNFKDDSKCLP